MGPFRHHGWAGLGLAMSLAQLGQLYQRSVSAMAPMQTRRSSSLSKAEQQQRKARNKAKRAARKRQRR